jgi:poly(3-hydroxybutyrate) depolymerase
MHPAVLAAGLLLSALGSAGPARAQTPGGWKRVEISSTGSYFLRYVPFNQDPGPMPVVLFLHGAGGSPEGYTGAVRAAAERARAVLVLPKSTTNLGWGVGEDEKTVDEALRLASEELPVDRRHVAISGHSAGGAYAYLLAYLRRSRYSAVFTLAASSYPVSAVADPDYRAPIRMYYGTLDPNYLNGPYASLKAQWNRLGVPWEEDVQVGYNHGSWPPSSMVDGFLFLTAHAYPATACVPGPTALCLLNGRFRAEVTWKDFSGATGPGHVVSTAADGSGLFWFFGPDNWELMVKAIDGCAANGHFWIFSSATTSVEYTLTVTDTRTGQAVPYANAAGRAAPAITDTAAFTCP